MSSAAAEVEGDDGGGVREAEHRALTPVRTAVPDHRGGDGGGARPSRRARSSGTRARGGGRTRSERSVTERDDEQRHLGVDEIAISLASRIFPRRAITIAPPCSAAFPTIATITTADEELADRPTGLANALERVDEDLAHQAVTPVATASVRAHAGSVQVCAGAVRCAASLTVASAQVPPRLAK